MAELVDALDSKSGYRKVVQVRFLFWALDYQSLMKGRFGDLLKFASNLPVNILTPSTLIQKAFFSGM
jgi:hypothetical protein